MALKRRPPQGNVRRVKTNSRNTWGVTTNQIGETVQFESNYEKNLLLTLIRDPEIEQVVSQPIAIEYIDPEGKITSIYPGF